MNTNRQRLFNRTTAPWAKLACPSGVNFWSLSSGAFSLIGKHKQKLRPASITHTFAYVGTGQAHDVEFLDKDNPVGVDQLAAEFVMKVKTLVSYLLMQVANLTGQFDVPATALLTTRAHLLKLGQFFFTGSEPARILNQFASGQGRKVFKAHVNPNASCGCGQGFDIRHFNLKRGKPITQVVTLENYLLDFGVVGQGAVLKHSYIAYSLDIKPVAFQPYPVVVDVANRLKPPFAFVTGEAWLLALPYPAKESIKGFVELSQSLLNRTIVDKGGILIKGANRLELVSLVNVANAFLVHLPGQPAFSQSIIVQTPVNFQDAVKRLPLLLIRIKPVAKREKHLSSRLGLNVLTDCFRGNVTGCTDIVGASPQARQAALEVRKFFSQVMRSCPFNPVHNLIRSEGWGEGSKQVNVVRTHNQFNHFALKVFSYLVNKFNQAVAYLANQNRPAILGAKDKVIIDIVSSVSCFVNCHKANYTLVLGKLSNL
jgi:hypothetical protein